MSRSRATAKKAGSAFEKLIAGGLAELLGDDRIERRTKNGTKDRGDITGVKTHTGGRVVVEAKDVRTMAMPAWLREAEAERINDSAAVGVVAHKRHGSAVAAEQYITMTLSTFALLVEGAHTITVIEQEPTA